ncbi:helix-turn-helix transcriptional regulator [Caulobacter soli]|uniref:helix-turn-helix transcriptional regulator n=1 Tax=Caulobacter soli TaxID=2708539 RepID=UPI0013EB315A|nr:autoinducer binding domain-containing protein [Caulobacter soli]
MSARPTALSAAAPIDPVSAYRAALGMAARRCGFAHAAYMHLGYRLPGETVAAPGRLISSGALDETLYRKRGYLAFDPLAARAAGAFAPFAWTLDDLAEPAARPLARAFEAWGVRSGLIAPIQDSTAGPAFVNFFVSEARSAPADAEAEAARDGGALLAAVRLHAMARADLPAAGVADGALNAREIHVLRLAAKGLTEMETAAELKLSRRGVQFHLSRAGAKLDTPNKTAAVARAIALGLLAP